MIRKLLTLFFLLVAIPSFSFAESHPDSPKEFVQAFYDWYLPLAAKGRGVPGSNYVFQHRQSSFSPQLIHALKEDSASQAKSPDEIVGLDGDAFLMSQDFADQYLVSDVTQKGDSFLVSLYGIQSGVKNEHPDVIAEIRLEKNHWVFVNFYDSDGANLLSILKELKASRKKTQR